MKRLAIILGVIVVGVAGLVFYASGRSDEYQLTRSTTVNAPPEKVYPLIEDFKLWTKWSPFESPDLTRTYGATTAGNGATYAWTGGQSGEGNMVITDATPSSKVQLTLNMVKPMAATNDVLFTIEPEGAGSRVTWTMKSHNTLPIKVLHVFMNPDAMVGPMFDQGLAKLKSEAEAQS